MQLHLGRSAKWIASCAALAALAGAASAAPTVDGKFDASEGYTGGQWIDFVISGGNSTLAEKGQLWTTQDANGDLYYAAVFSKGLVDNSYGENSIGWGKKTHTFGNLVGSDHAAFELRDGAGNLVYNFKQDYISEIKGAKGSSSSYASLGVSGGDGGVLSPKGGKGGSGQESWFLGGASSLEYNLKNVAFLTEDSPFANQDYSNPSNPDWIYEVIYEGKISSAAFGGNGYGGLQLTDAHVSPPKVNATPVPGNVIPEPGTLALFAAGGLFPLMAIRRRRR